MTDNTKYEIEVKRTEIVQCPSAPNFFLTSEGKKISVKDLHDAEIDALGRVWASRLKARKLEMSTTPTAKPEVVLN